MGTKYKHFFHPAFIICVAVLAAAGIMKKTAIDKLGIELIKLPLPLQKPFAELDTAKLTSYNVTHRAKIPEDVEEAILQMNMLGHQFYLFLNAATEKINVVYMRKGGGYGVLEPEYE